MSSALQIVLLFAFGLAGAFAGSPCSYTEKKEAECTTVVEVATDAGLTTLLAAVEAAGLVEAVNDPGAGLTIFAPTNKAFSAAVDALGVTLEELVENTDLLTQILTYHVLPSAEMSSALAKKGSLTTLLGSSSPCGEPDLSFVDEDGVFTVKGGASSAEVTAANVKACSTIIHVIDTVLLSCPV